ncbi:MAG: hypothetical protein IJN92_04515 [Lachnospiraceae bacterium]|nr:hypothetical protein [Lachnospiraceae bacterium]
MGRIRLTPFNFLFKQWKNLQVTGLLMYDKRVDKVQIVVDGTKAVEGEEE